ncbi:uncharacterized protein LOC113670114, partial [Pocillopora damicornis]|uniref:uncharacterized protein LOC113670114 n=1 Tax=Pocillopora damicornis TaxID=46731 RepID=UPI000F552D12
FADDTKIYRQINNVEDSIALQIDVTTLNLWADRWQMKFNPTKHVEQIVHKANRVLGLFKRTVGGKNKDIFSNLYKTLVRPIYKIVFNLNGLNFSDYFELCRNTV